MPRSRSPEAMRAAMARSVMPGLSALEHAGSDLRGVAAEPAIPFHLGVCERGALIEKERSALRCSVGDDVIRRRPANESFLQSRWRATAR